MQSFRKSVASSFLCSKGAGYSSSLGTIGLMKAVDTFDSTRRARFSTYASRCIENPSFFAFLLGVWFLLR